MAILGIDVPLLKKMVMNGAINLKNHHQEVDELNVFPVPDGDTGTNMQMTVMSGVREMNNCQSTSIVEVAKILSRGCLMGARGNSGVILSQFFRGLYVAIKEINKDVLDKDDFLNVLISGYKVAYKAVMEPVEGTILTVVREAACNTEAHKNEFSDITAMLSFYLVEAQKSLDNTPNLLPVLKEAGVVDSGGTGFVKIVEGMLLALEGKIIENEEAKPKETKPAFAYCVEFIIELNNKDSFNESDIKAPLSLLGDTLITTVDDNLYKLHIHTNKPGRVVDYAQRYGEFLAIKIENLRIKHTELEGGVYSKKPKKKYALVAVCFGDGITQTFKDLGVDYVIEGGQTMNPSTNDFVDAINKVNANNVIIIPNNSNVIMAAEQSVSLCKDTNVRVLKTKTIAQGYASLMVYDQNVEIDENVEEMTKAIKNVGSGEVTYSIRDTEINGVKIAVDDYMGIADGKIIVSCKDKAEASQKLLAALIKEDSEIVTIFYGQDVTKEEVEALADYCNEVAPDIDVEVIDGKQDIYSYIISVE